MKPGERIRAFVDATYRRLAEQTPDHTPWTPVSGGGIGKLNDYLESVYGHVLSLQALDTAVFKITWRDGPAGVVRLFPHSRSMAEVATDQAVLDALTDWREIEDPIEDGVGRIGDEPVWLTRFSAGEARPASAQDAATIGDLIGRLHVLPDEWPFSRVAGAWHGVSPAGGTRRDDFAVLAELLDDARALAGATDRPFFDSILDEVLGADHCDDLPLGFSHVDPYQPNVLWRGDVPTFVDWAGAGRAPRSTMLPLLPYASELTLVDAFCRAYARHVELEPRELERLADALRGHSLLIDAWSAVFVPARVREIAANVRQNRRRAAIVAARVRENFPVRQRQR